MYSIKKHCDICHKEMKIEASSYKEWEQGHKLPTKEWNLAYSISGLHICNNCALLIDNCLIRLKLEAIQIIK